MSPENISPEQSNPRRRIRNRIAEASFNAMTMHQISKRMAEIDSLPAVRAAMHTGKRNIRDGGRTWDRFNKHIQRHKR